MTSDRPYRRALPWGAAHDEILAQSGRQFDPEVVAAFLECEERMRETRESSAAAA
jgi:HD-GYP domain-containing protein (c-di-GMP phosphodiesterase class II)